MPGPVRQIGELIGAALDTRQSDIHTSYAGIVKKYDSSTLRAEIETATHNPVTLADGSLEFKPLPIIPDVPICHLSAPGFSITFPIAVGTPVLVVCTVLDPSQFRSTGLVGPPGFIRRHAIGYAHAIPSVAFGGPGPGLPGAAINALILEGASIQLGLGATDFIALAAKVLTELGVVKSSFDSHTHPYIDTPAGPATTSPPTVPMTTASSVAAVKAKAE